MKKPHVWGNEVANGTVLMSVDGIPLILLHISSCPYRIILWLIYKCCLACLLFIRRQLKGNNAVGSLIIRMLRKMYTITEVNYCIPLRSMQIVPLLVEDVLPDAVRMYPPQLSLDTGQRTATNMYSCHPAPCSLFVTAPHSHTLPAGLSPVARYRSCLGFV